MVTTFYPPYNFGGDGVFVQRLSEALSRAGHEVHVVHDADAFRFVARDLAANDLSSTSSPPDPSIVVHDLGTDNGAAWQLLLAHQLGHPAGKTAKLQEVLGQQFDVIHYHNVSLLGGPALLKFGAAPVKLCTLHDHWFVCATHALWRNNSEACTKRTCLSCTISSGKPPQLWRYGNAIRDSVTSINAFLAPSEFARRSHLSNGFPADIQVLPHFYPESYLGTIPDVVADYTHPFFLFVGRLEKLKGVQVLIELFRTYSGAELVIAGSGAFEQELKQQAAGLGNVRFVGRVGQTQLSALYRQCLAVIVPSLCYETFGLVALEAFAHETPVIVNNLGALPEVINDGGGLSYQNQAGLRAAMERLSTDRCLRHELGKAGLANLRANYTEQRHLSRYYEMISRYHGC